MDNVCCMWVGGVGGGRGKGLQDLCNNKIRIIEYTLNFVLETGKLLNMHRI